MYCPRCGQEQISAETRFCSRCGFLMAGVTALLHNGGNLPYQANPKNTKLDTPRKKGIKQGIFIFLLSFLVVPLISILTIAAGAEPFAVVISAILLTVGGLLRIAYAMMFEANEAPPHMLEQSGFEPAQNQLNQGQGAGALPPRQSIPVDAYAPPKAGNWMDTNDLTPGSVTDTTTKLLQREEK